MPRRAKVIIDRSNWIEYRLLPGDKLLNALNEPMAEVVAIGKSGKKRGIVRVKTIKGGFEYVLDGGRSHYEQLIEFLGYRFEREVEVE